MIQEKSILENNDYDDNDDSGRCCSREYVKYMLQQQDELRKLGIYDDMFLGLSVISRSCSKKSRKDAEQRAIRLHHAECM